jgi:hypothetical protein
LELYHLGASLKILPLERTQLSETSQARLQDNITNFTIQFLDCPLLKGRMIESVALTTSAQKIEHKLGVTPVGYLITSQSANSVIYSTAKDQNFLTLQASTNVIVNIWVF